MFSIDNIECRYEHQMNSCIPWLMNLKDSLFACEVENIIVKHLNFDEIPCSHAIAAITYRNQYDKDNFSSNYSN